MPHGSRISFLILLAALVTPAGVAAQSNVVTPAPPAREGTVGPEQLRDFALPGTRTSPEGEAETAPQPRETPAPDQAASPRPEPSASATTPRPAVTTPVTEVAPPPVETESRTRPSSTQSVGLAPPAQSPLTTSTEPAFTPAFTPTPITSPTDPAAGLSPVTNGDGSSPFAWWPWLLAALAVAGAAVFLVRRQREEQGNGTLAFAGGVPAPAPSQPRPVPRPVPAPPRAAPRPAPAPVPAPAPAPAPPKSVGVVSSRLRPWVEIEMLAERAILTEEEVIIEFELAVTNNGSAPARHVVVEAVALNAGDTQDQEIATFFERPDNPDGGIEVVPPLGHVTLRNRVRMPRSAMREYAVGDRRLLVPIIAFNAGYRWSGGSGRRGAAFLIGRGGDGAEKMGPLRLDLGPREFRPLTQRRLEPAVRR